MTKTVSWPTVCVYLGTLGAWLTLVLMHNVSAAAGLLGLLTSTGLAAFPSMVQSKLPQPMTEQHDPDEVRK